MYQTIIENNTFELVEKKSKFIANIINVNNKEIAENKIKEIKKKYHDARHNCYAYRVLQNEVIYEKLSDDGEPSGTAGAPMLDILKKENLCNVLVVVTRYFGGILLGTGGLVRAYSGATQGAIQSANMVTVELGAEYQLEIEYPEFQNIQYYMKKNGIKIIKADYDEKVILNVDVKDTIREKFIFDINNRNIKINELKELERKYI